jgi:hypothetical protein
MVAFVLAVMNSVRSFSSAFHRRVEYGIHFSLRKYLCIISYSSILQLTGEGPQMITLGTHEVGVE